MCWQRSQLCRRRNWRRRGANYLWRQPYQPVQRSNCWQRPILCRQRNWSPSHSNFWLPWPLPPLVRMPRGPYPCAGSLHLKQEGVGCGYIIQIKQIRLRELLAKQQGEINAVAVTCQPQWHATAGDRPALPCDLEAALEPREGEGGGGVLGRCPALPG
jgi:hypothetical protein